MSTRLSDQLEGRRVTVMGLGRFGGGLGVTRWLVSRGARVTLTDLDSAEKLEEPLDTLSDLISDGSVTLRLGGHEAEDFQRTDLVVANPAVPRPWANTLLEAARGRGIPVTTEMVLLIEQLPDRRSVVGVTGTSGKSTTAAMIAHALGDEGRRVHLGGNIGGSLLDRLGEIKAGEPVVLELSSFMLYWLGGPYPAWSPGVAVVTGFAPNHLDWHGSPDHYERCKRTIFEFQQEGDTLILDDTMSHWRARQGVHRVLAGSGKSLPSMRLPGRHNRRNAALALEACVAVTGRGDKERRATLGYAVASFPGLPHRLFLVGQRAGVRYYDDSKSTTPEATATAIEALDESGVKPSRIRLIAGGYDRGADLTPMFDAIRRLGGVYAIGQTTRQIVEGGPKGRSWGFETLEAAFEAASSAAAPDEVVLLSPGCASWDQYANFEQRGQTFIMLARKAGVTAPEKR